MQRRELRPKWRARASVVVSMSLASLLAVLGAVPVQAAELGLPGVPPTEQRAAAVDLTAEPPQSLPTVTVAAPIVVRDGYSVTEAPEPAPQLASAGGNYRWPFPTAVRISDTFGPRNSPCDGCSSLHKGLDMNGGEGTFIGAVADGVVRDVTEYDDGGLGVHAIIDHTVNGRLVSSVYAHMLSGSLAVSAGQAVVAGQQLGRVGSTGQSTGPHLHLEILLDGVTPTDPFAWLTEWAGPQ